MTDTVIGAVVDLLTAAGIAAGREYAGQAGEAFGAPAVRVGVKKSTLRSAGCGDYLGVDSTGGTETELYGCRLELTLGFDVFAPDARSGEQCWEAVCAALQNAPAGLKIRALSLGGAGYDPATERVLCRGEAECMAYLIRTAPEDGGAFTDFILRGVLTK